jgi:hypothetical protein
VSLTGRGRPRWVAAADRSPQIRPILLPAEITGLLASQPSSIARLRGIQCLSLVHWVSSPTVTNVTRGCFPANREANADGSRPLNDRDATSVSRTTARTRHSGKVGVAGRGDEG